METLALVAALAAGIGFSVFLVVRHHAMRTKDDDLFVRGVATTAKVVRLRQDGESAEDDAFVLSVEMTVPAGVTYRTTGEAMTFDLRAFLAAHVLPSVQPGSTIRLRIDPQRPERAVVDLRAMNLV